MRRRNILAATGSAIVTGLAGCLGGSEGNGDGNGGSTAGNDGEQESSDGKNTAPIEDWGYYSPTATQCREEEYFGPIFHNANSAEIYCGFNTINRCVAIEANIWWDDDDNAVVVEMEEQEIDPPEETPTDKPDDEGYSEDCKDCGEKLHLRARGVSVQTTKDMERARGVYIDVDGNRTEHEEIREES